MAPGEPYPAGLVYSMDLQAGTSCARLPDNMRARLDAVEAARGGGADKRPLAPFPPQPDTPPVVTLAGDEKEEEQEAEDKGDEEAYGPRESALALMYEDDARPDVYAGMDVDPANVPLLPMPTAPPPPPLGSCEQRHCRFHAAARAHRHRLTGAGRREAGMLAGALERYEFQRPGQVAQEKALVAESPDDGQLRFIQLEDAAVLDHHPSDVRAADPQEGLPLPVRLSVGRLLHEAGLEDVRRDGGVYVALWRGGADAWRREQAVRPLTPQALGSHALLVAMHPEGAEVVFGTDRLLPLLQKWHTRRRCVATGTCTSCRRGWEKCRRRNTCHCHSHILVVSLQSANCRQFENAFTTAYRSTNARTVWAHVIWRPTCLICRAIWFTPSTPRDSVRYAATTGCTSRPFRR